MKSETKLDLLLLIVPEQRAEAVVKELNRKNFDNHTAQLGVGTARSEIRSLLAIGEKERVILTLIGERGTLLKTLRDLAARFTFDRAGMGVGMLLPMSGICGGKAFSTALGNGMQEVNRKKTVGFLRKNKKIDSDDREIDDRKEILMETRSELIVTIVNRGFAEAAMDAARAAGATGGTVSHGRGTGGKEAKKILGIEIQPEKEILLILVPEPLRNAVMRAVTEAAGLDTNGQGICFSLPVEAAAGVSFASSEAKTVPFP